MKTTSDTGFVDDDEAVPCRGTDLALSGKAGDMTEELKAPFVA